MDSVTRGEFHKIFKRTSETVNLKGCLTPEDVEERLKKTKKLFKKARDLHVRKESREKLVKKIRGIDRLLYDTQHPSFSQAVIIESVEHPLSIVNMTLKFGRKKAQDIILSRTKVRLRLKREGASRRYTKLHRRG